MRKQLFALLCLFWCTEVQGRGFGFIESFGVYNTCIYCLFVYYLYICRVRVYLYCIWGLFNSICNVHVVFMHVLFLGLWFISLLVRGLCDSLPYVLVQFPVC